MQLVTIIISLFILSGCASYGKEIHENSVCKIQRGITTKQEILDTFGKPDGTYFDRDNKLIIYYFAGKMKQSAWNFIPIVNIFHTEMNMNNQMLTIILSKDNIVEEYSFTNPDKKISAGIIP